MAIVASGSAVADTPDLAHSSPPADADINQHVAWLVARSKGRGPGSYRYLLVLRFAVLNTAGLLLLAFAYVQGYVGGIFAADGTGLSAVIFAVFLAGLALCGHRVVRTSRELNQVKEFDPLSPSRAAQYLAQIRGKDGQGRAIAASALRLRLGHRIGVVRHFANSLIFMGLIGTVIGFIIALSGVDPAEVADVASIGPMVATLIEGMSVALYTTLVGAVLNLWLMINYHMLSSGTVNLINGIVELGEQHAGA